MIPIEFHDWNAGFKSEAPFHDSSIQQQQPTAEPAPQETQHPFATMNGPRRVPTSSQTAPEFHQKAVYGHDANAMHADSLHHLPNARHAEFWLSKAAALEASNDLEEAERVLMDALNRDVQPVTSVARALHELAKRRQGTQGAHTHPLSPAPGSAAATSCPRAITPNRTGVTGQAMRVPSQLAKTPGAAGASAAVPLPTKFHGILKKLEFPTTAEPAALATAQHPQTTTTTTKRLHFDIDTPMGGITGEGLTAFKSHGRRVTFGGATATASPSTHRPNRTSFAAFQTPPAAVSEGDGTGSDEGADEGGAGGTHGTVNSRNAGATPFDRRLSSLFAKYGGDTLDGGDEMADMVEESEEFGDGFQPHEDVEEEEEDGGLYEAEKEVARMSSGPVADSMRALSSPASRGGGGASIQQSEAAAAPTPNTAIASVLGELLRRSLEDIQASKEEEISRPQRPLLAGVISPSSGILRVTPEIPQRAVAAPPTASTGATATPNSGGSIPSPAAGGIDLLSPGSDISAAMTSYTSLTPMSIDGVERNNMGIPLVTPGTVTLFRGSGGMVRPRRSDGITADLFRSFDTPPVTFVADHDNISSSEVAIVAVPTEQIQQQQQNEHTAQQAAHQEEQAQHGGGGFTFDTAPTTRRASESPVANGDTLAEDEDDGTPDFQPRSASKPARRATPLSSSVSRIPRVSHMPSPLHTTQEGTPVAHSLGKAQRVPSPSPVSVTREVRGLFDGLSLKTPARSSGIELSPACASAKQRMETGVDVVVTQVRRSPRLAKSEGATEGSGDMMALLEASEYSYVPNRALSTTPAPEEDDTDSSQRAPRTKGKEQPSVSGATTRRYSTRSATKASKKDSPSSSGESALKLSPTEQNIRDSLRSSSRKKSTLGSLN